MDGNLEVFDCFVIAVGRVSGGTVGGTALGVRHSFLLVVGGYTDSIQMLF